jgi:hypothetical protein
MRADYAQKILRGKEYVDNFLKQAGKSLDKLTPYEYADLSNGLGHLMGKW